MTAAAKAATRSVEATTAYADDFYTWTQDQAARLRSGDLDALDLENLAEEIDGLGKSQFSGLAGALRIVLLHMLKFDHQPSRRTRGWAISIATHRQHVFDELRDSPGLKSRLEEAVSRAFRGARLEASRETGLPLKTFPETCPYTRDEILARPYPIDPDDAA